MELIIVILSLFILIAGFFFIKDRNTLKNALHQKNTMVTECKNLIIRKNEEINRVKNQNQILIKKNQIVEEIKTDLMEFEFAAEEKKRELELIANRYGLTKMDEHLLFLMIQNKNKMSKTLLSNWLPYGKELGKISLLEDLIERLK
jgi:hypothetical protein